MVISLASGKGGTGKTSVAVNMAISIGKVQLLDCDVEEPNAHLLLNPEIMSEEPAYMLIPNLNEELCNHSGKCSDFCQFTIPRFYLYMCTIIFIVSFLSSKNFFIFVVVLECSQKNDPHFLVYAIVGAIRHYKVTYFKPFDPISKRTEATVEANDGTKFKVAKGAEQAILSLVADKEVVGTDVAAIVDSFASKGYRALGVAKTDEKGKWQFIGLVALYDPPREDSAETLKVAQSMGVHVKMVTGDHIAIAKEIAKQVGLGTNIVTASAFVDKEASEAARVVKDADGFAQVFPEHKYRIVELLQDRNHIVGMTGDGVNDVPALKKADAAKSAADIVFTKPGLSVIIDAIKESRKIFQRMTNYAIYRICETIRVLFFITASIVVFNFYPVTPLMIVLLAILNDMPIMTILNDIPTAFKHGDSSVFHIP